MLVCNILILIMCFLVTFVEMLQNSYSNIFIMLPLQKKISLKLFSNNLKMSLFKKYILLKICSNIFIMLPFYIKKMLLKRFSNTFKMLHFH